MSQNNVVPIDERVTNGEVHSGQVRMAHRLAHRFSGHLLHVHDVGWHRWDGQRWLFDDVGEAERSVLAVLRDALAESIGGDADLRRDVRKCESARGIHGVLEVAAALEPMVATVRDLDADPYLLNCSNGTVNLRTGRLWPHDPADRITKVAAGSFDPEARGEVWPAIAATPPRRALGEEVLDEDRSAETNERDASDGFRDPSEPLPD